MKKNCNALKSYQSAAPSVIPPESEALQVFPLSRPDQAMYSWATAVIPLFMLTGMSSFILQPVWGMQKNTIVHFERRVPDPV